jgi:hypothetical protein
MAHTSVKVFFFTFLPILIEGVETCIHVKIPLRAVSIKPICVSIHIVIGNMTIRHVILGIPPVPTEAIT